jgi:choline dehydrogenase-like flavoprotein
MPKKSRAPSPEYDVVIVGAGVAGSILALELAKQHRRVLVLEAGRSTRDDEDGWRTILDTFYNALAKVPNSPYPPTASAPQPDVLQYNPITPGVPDSAGYFVQHGPQTFSSDYTRSKGGTGLHWLGTTLRMLPSDFRMRSRYGVGADWPMAYEDLKPCYERAEHEIGVAGAVGEQRLPGVNAKRFWGDYQFPMQKLPDSYLARRLAARLDGLKVPLQGKPFPVYVTPTPQGRNSTPNPDYVNPQTGERGFQPVGTPGDPRRGERCMGNASCVPICPVQAKYSPLRTLHKAQALTSEGQPLVRLQCQAVASRVLTDPATGRVTGIEYITYDQNGGPTSTQAVRAKTYVVAAHSVETAKLLLISGLAQQSDQLGRNLMDHPTMMTWGLMPEPVWPFRGPGSTNAIPVFRDGAFRSEHSAFVVPIDNWGWNWCAFAPGAQLGEWVGQGLFGRQLRRRVARDFSRQICLQWEFEQLGEARNRVTIDPRFRDALGLPRPVIHYTISDYVRKAMAAAAGINAAICRQAGIQDCTSYSPNSPGYVEYEGKGYVYRGCGHLVGTHRMGAGPHDSVTDSWMRCWEHPNLYLVGCGAMPTFGTSNPTLTMAALTYRAADSILRDLV